MPGQALFNDPVVAAPPQGGKALFDDPVASGHSDQSGPKGFGDQLVSAAENFWDQINPVKAAKGVTDAVLNLGSSVNSYGDRNSAILKKAEDAYKAGDYSGAVSHGLNYLLNGVPGVGSTLDEATDQAKSGDVGGALGKTAGLAATIIGLHKAPEVASAAADATKSATDFASEVASHPKVQQALKDAAVEAVKEVPLVKTAIKGGKVASAVKEVIDDIRGARAVADVPTAAAPEAPAPIPESRQLAAPAIVTPAPDTSGVIPGWKPTVLEREPVATAPEPVKATPVVETPQPVESKAPPSAWLPPEELDNAKTTGLPVEKHMANRAAMAQRFVEKIGGTQNLPTNQSEWARLADDLGERVPSKETQAQIEFGLNRRMVTKTETAGSEASTPSAVARNPKALKIAQKLQAEMESSGTTTKEVPSMPVSVKGTAADIKSVGPTVPGIGATVTLKNGKTVIVKELHPDGTFDYE